MRLILADKKIAQEILNRKSGAFRAMDVVTATSLEEVTGFLASDEGSVVLISDGAADLDALRKALGGSHEDVGPVLLIANGIGRSGSNAGELNADAVHGVTPGHGVTPDISSLSAAGDRGGSTLEDSGAMPTGEWLCSLSGAVSEAVVRVHAGRLTEVDGGFARKMGFSVATVPGTRVGNLFLPSDRYALHTWLRQAGQAGDGSLDKGSIRLTMRGEEGEFPVLVSHTPSTGSRDDTLLLLEPVGESHLIHNPPELLLPTDLDALTGLPDHHWFLEAVRQAIARARYNRQGCCILVCRLEGLQAIERQLGEDAMNDACQTAAIRLRRAAGPGSSLARIGPYEFACVFVSGDAAGLAEQQILRFQRAIRPPVTSGSSPMHLSLRFGASEYTSRMERPRALIRLARTRAAVAFLLERPVAKVSSRVLTASGSSSLEQEIDRACDRNEFELFLQPIIHLRSFAIRGAEVLVRWRHPERGLLSPAHFLPMAESTGQISRIGQWVLEAVCEHSSQWGRSLQKRPRFSVNVSPVELHDHRFLATTLAILAKYPLDAVEIELEITETAVLASESKTAEVVECLRRQGIKVALDDFGVGYSSLSHLREIPFSKLKIDRTFVHGSPASHRCRTIVRSMVELARGLRIEVTAEGVENPDQLRFLYEAGCDEVQGYLFARPMPPSRFDSWVAGYQGKASEAFGKSEVQSGESTGKVLPFHRNALLV